MVLVKGRDGQLMTLSLLGFLLLSDHLFGLNREVVAYHQCLDCLSSSAWLRCLVAKKDDDG